MNTCDERMNTCNECMRTCNEWMNICDECLNKCNECMNTRNERMDICDECLNTCDEWEYFRLDDLDGEDKDSPDSLDILHLDLFVLYNNICIFNVYTCICIVYCIQKKAIITFWKSQK